MAGSLMQHGSFWQMRDACPPPFFATKILPRKTGLSRLSRLHLCVFRDYLGFSRCMLNLPWAQCAFEHNMHPRLGVFCPLIPTGLCNLTAVLSYLKTDRKVMHRENNLPTITNAGYQIAWYLATTKSLLFPIIPMYDLFYFWVLPATLVFRFIPITLLPPPTKNENLFFRKNLLYIWNRRSKKQPFLAGFCIPRWIKRG